MLKRVICLSVLLLLLLAKAYTQGCPVNVDFEHGDFSNWQCSVGKTYDTNAVNITSLQPSAPLATRHEIISAATPGANDPYGLFPKLCPYGGKYSVKLGNDRGGAQAEGLSYTFTVPANVDTFSFTYYYAVVFQDPSHAPHMQPRFIVTAYDVITGASINCSSFDFIADGTIPGFNVSPVQRDVLYKDWTPASLQFGGLRGRQIRLEFRTADCTPGQHFGYAYIDVASSCSKMLATASYCSASNSLVLNAPYGYQSYTWYNADFSANLGNTQFVTLSPPPVNNGLYYVDLVPYPGFGCRDTAPAVATPMNVPDTPAVKSEYSYCQFDIAPPLVATPSPGNTLLWYTTATGGVASFYTPTPSTITPGIFNYYVSEKVLYGCESDRRKITVNVSPIAITKVVVNSAKQCLQGNNFIFTSSGLYNHNAVYDWDLGDGTTLTAVLDSVVSHHYSSTGSYSISLRVKSNVTCPYETSMSVSVTSKPIASFTYPTIICQDQTPVTLTSTSVVPGNSSAINKWWWNINGTISQLESPLPVTINTPGSIPVALVVTTAGGCSSDTSRAFIKVSYKPVAAFNYDKKLCTSGPIPFTDHSSLPPTAIGETITKWTWKVDTIPTSNMQNPSLLLTASTHHINLSVQTSDGCNSNDADSILVIDPRPALSVHISDSCVNKTTRFAASDNSNTATKWYWNFGNGYAPGSNNITKSFTSEGSYSFAVIGETSKGCRDTLYRPFVMYGNKAFAGADTIAAMNQPLQLNANGGSNVRYTWTPAIGLNNAFIENPIAILDRDQQYRLYAVTDKGCESHSQITIKRYNGPALYIPTAFTPNGDGLNEVLRVIPVGIRHFKLFSIYNRYGERIFYTTNYQEGWNGLQNGRPATPGTYVAFAEGIDFNNHPILNKTTVVLIR
jgi:gliding motility-associated-like protein